MANPVTAPALPLAPFASPSAGTPPPGAEPPPAHARVPVWRPIEGLGRALTALFVVAAAAAACGVLTRANRLIVLGDLEEAGDATRELADRADRADDLVTVATVAVACTMLVITAVFIVWTWRAAKNNEALGRDRPRLAPAWAIAGWFIPLGNLVLPALLIQDLWRGADPSIPRGDMRWRITGRSLLVGWWWGSLVAASLFVGSSGGVADRRLDVDDLRAGDFLALFAMLAAVASAVLAVLVVRRIAGRQRAALHAQQTAWTAAHAASGT